GNEVEVAVGDMHGEDSARLQMPQIGFKGLHREQVHRDRVTGKGVERENVEILRAFALERQSRVAERHLDLRRAVLQKSEFRAGELDHSGIDVVEAKDV